jgi:hypothetical protein
METKKNSEHNGNAHLELVLEEFINDQKSQTKTISDLTGVFNSFTDKLNIIEKRINNPKPISVATDMQPIQELIKKCITDIKLIVSTQEQRPLVKKYQLLLFPEKDTKLFYKIVFGRWFLWIVVILFLANLYKFSLHWSDNQKEIDLKSLENDRIKSSWYYLYSKGSKGFKKIMDSAYIKSEIPRK